MESNIPSKRAKRRNGVGLGGCAGRGYCGGCYSGGGGGPTGGGTGAVLKQRPTGPRSPKARVRKPRSRRASGRGRSAGEPGACAGDPGEDAGRGSPWEARVTESPPPPGGHALWPPGMAFVVYVVTLTSRVWLVTNVANWWILHPDEVFQSLEVAHSEVYGYGFRPYEFLPPHTAGSEMTSLADRQEAEMGMYSLRSWLYPRLFMAVFHLSDYFGGSESPFVVGKVFHAVVAAHLPLTVYFFTSSITQSRDIGSSAAILVSFSEHLAVLGTHTLVNSFLSPILFAALAAIHGVLGAGATASRRIDSDSDSDSMTATASCSGTPTKDVNGNAKCQFDPAEKVDSRHCKMVLTAANEEEAQKGDRNKISGQHKPAKADGICVAVGSVLALLCYIRVDIVLFVAGIGFLFFTEALSSPIRHRKQFALLLLGGAAGVLVGATDDSLSYGGFLLSPIQWFRFNVLTDLPSVIFGWDRACTYVEFILNYNLITRLQTLLLTASCLLALYRLWFVDEALPRRRRHLDKCLLQLVLATAALFTVYSLKGHKEVRFVHNVIVLFQISSALSFSIAYRRLVEAAPGWLHTVRLHARVIFALFTLGLVLNYPAASDRSNQKWAYKGIWDSHHINQCLDFIRRQPDVSGLFSDRGIHETAAYSILHKDIPIFSLFHNEFMEFDKSARKTLPANKLVRGARETVSVSVTSQVSNLISTENSPLLLKTLVAEPSYNYLVLKTSRKLVHVGFEEVFRAGTMRVMRRMRNESEADKLQRIADSIPIGRNATVLEHEGSRLMTFGLRQLALERLEAAADLDMSRVRVFQLLALIYRDVGRSRDARHVTARCYRHNGQARCLESQPKVVLHPEYPG